MQKLQLSSYGFNVQLLNISACWKLSKYFGVLYLLHKLKNSQENRIKHGYTQIEYFYGNFSAFSCFSYCAMYLKSTYCDIFTPACIVYILPLKMFTFSDKFVFVPRLWFYMYIHVVHKGVVWFVLIEIYIFLWKRITR